MVSRAVINALRLPLPSEGLLALAEDLFADRTGFFEPRSVHRLTSDATQTEVSPSVPSVSSEQTDDLFRSPLDC